MTTSKTRRVIAVGAMAVAALGGMALGSGCVINGHVYCPPGQVAVGHDPGTAHCIGKSL